MVRQKVTIITVCFNRVKTIGAAIESVLLQDYPDIEYLIIDGNSTDGTVEVINKYKDRVTKTISEPDHGMYEAINKGIRMATGDIIGLVHSDDMLLGNHVISDVVNQIEKTNADLCYGNGIFVNDHKIVRNWISGKYHRWKVRIGWLPLHSTCYFKKDVLMKGGLYDEHYKIAADSDLLVRYLYEYNLKISYLNEYIICYRMGGLSTNTDNLRLMWQEDIEIYRSHGFIPVPTKIMKMIWKIPQFIIKECYTL